MPIVKNVAELDVDYIRQLSNNKFFDDYIPHTISARTYELIKVSEDRQSFKLIDKEQRDLISSIHGNFKNYNKIEYFEIEGTYSKIERRGHLTYLFQVLIYEFDYKVLSDGIHSSPGSKEFWQTQIRRKNFSVYRLNLKTSDKRNAINFKENEIWGLASPYSYGFNIDEDEIIIVENFDNLDDLNRDSDDLDDIVESSILETEDFALEEIKENLLPNTIQDYIPYQYIRLVAQKYVD